PARMVDEAIATINLGMTLTLLKENAEGDRSLVDGATLLASLVGENHQLFAMALQARAELCLRSGDPARARPLIERARRIMHDALPDGHPDTVQTMRLYGQTLAQAGEL